MAPAYGVSWRCLVMATPPAVTNRSAPPSSTSIVIPVSIRSSGGPGKHLKYKWPPGFPLRPQSFNAHALFRPPSADPPPEHRVRNRIHGFSITANEALRNPIRRGLNSSPRDRGQIRLERSPPAIQSSSAPCLAAELGASPTSLIRSSPSRADRPEMRVRT